MTTCMGLPMNGLSRGPGRLLGVLGVLGLLCCNLSCDDCYCYCEHQSDKILVGFCFSNAATKVMSSLVERSTPTRTT